MAQVSFKGVRKSYGNAPVIHGFDMDVKDGEFVVIVGPSGCGKSTLLRMVAGLEAISDGEIAIGGRVVNEKSLKPVPRAHNAARLGGLPAEAFLVECPQGTIPAAGVCVESVARPPAPYSEAVHECAITDNEKAIGRRLPDYGELISALEHQGIGLAPGGELTSEVQASAASPGQIEDLYVADNVGHVGLTPDTAAGAKGYRCVAPPLN